MDKEERQEMVDTVVGRIETMVAELDEGLSRVETKLDLAEMTEGPTKRRMAGELRILQHAVEIMGLSFERLQATLLEHYGVRH